MANSNVGFGFALWDRLLGTYRDQPRGGHVAMAIGLAGHTDPHEVSRLPGMVALPFRGESPAPAREDTPLDVTPRPT
jgi:hypothetical protein